MNNNKARFSVNCLIRDKLIEFFGNDGIDRIVEKLSIEDFKKEILNKLVEEANEVKESKNRTELIEELCDVLTVYRSILNLYNINQEEIENAINEKISKRGAFDKGLFLSDLLVPKDNQWYEVFKKKYKLIQE